MVGIMNLILLLQDDVGKQIFHIFPCEVFPFLFHCDISNVLLGCSVHQQCMYCDYVGEVSLMDSLFYQLSCASELQLCFYVSLKLKIFLIIKSLDYELILAHCKVR